MQVKEKTIPILAHTGPKPDVQGSLAAVRLLVCPGGGNSV